MNVIDTIILAPNWRKKRVFIKWQQPLYLILNLKMAGNELEQNTMDSGRCSGVTAYLVANPAQKI
jgi:hypothetical protein